MQHHNTDEGIVDCSFVEMTGKFKVRALDGGHGVERWPLTRGLAAAGGPGLGGLAVHLIGLVARLRSLKQGPGEIRPA